MIHATYSCQSYRMVPSAYLKYAAKAFNTVHVPPPTTFPCCVKKDDFTGLFLPVGLSLESFILLSPNFEKPKSPIKFFATTIWSLCSKSSAEVFLIEVHISFDFPKLPTRNFFKSSSMGREPVSKQMSVSNVLITITCQKNFEI